MNVEQEIEKRGYCCLSITSSDIKLERQAVKCTVVILCTGGEAVLEMNMEQVRVTAGCRICYSHVMLMRLVSVSADFEALALMTDDKFALQALIGIETDVLQDLFRTPVRAITDNIRWKLLYKLFESLRLYSAIGGGKNRQDVAQSIFRSMAIVLSDDVGGERMRQQSGYSAADTYFRNFINLINDHVVKEHEVAYYAEQLNITSKYLNEVCKLKSGHKAKEIISSILVTFIKRELMYSSKSMKELAAEFNFADQSSMGKFFRKLTGQSPLTFKRNQL